MSRACLAMFFLCWLKDFMGVTACVEVDLSAFMDTRTILDMWCASNAAPNTRDHQGVTVGAALNPFRSNVVLDTRGFYTRGPRTIGQEAMLLRGHGGSPGGANKWTAKASDRFSLASCVSARGGAEQNNTHI